VFDKANFANVNTVPAMKYLGEMRANIVFIRLEVLHHLEHKTAKKKRL